jgi:hypothetical protein
MRRCECFYFGAEDTGVVLVDWRFGMKVCEIHRPNGERDCRAYLHRQNFVRIEDAFEIPALKKFLDVLAANPLCRVERTNGTIDEDWSLRIGNIMEPAFFSYSSSERWGVPMYCKRINQNKTVPIINFLQPEISTGMVLPADWHAVIEGAIDILKEGIYKADAEAYDYARNHDESETIAETAGVAAIIYEGREERVFIGEGRPRENGTDRTNGVEEIGDPA